MVRSSVALVAVVLLGGCSTGSSGAAAVADGVATVADAGEPSTPEEWFASRPAYCERTLDEFEWLEYEGRPPSVKYDAYPGIDPGYAHMVDSAAYEAARSSDDLTGLGLVLIEGASGGEVPLDEAVDYALQPNSRTSQNLAVLLRRNSDWAHILSVYAADEFCDFRNVPYHGVEYVEGD